jgi:hypothetical protein
MSDGKRVLILGATSAIAERWARLRAEAGDHLLLVARSSEQLVPIAADLKARGAGSVETLSSELASMDDQAARFTAMVELLGGLDVVLLAYGDLGDQDRAQTDAEFLRDQLIVNFASAAVWCELAAAELERRGSGVLAVISSVAGDRGRRIGYAYGAAKGGLSRFAEGLAHRFAGTAVRVLCVRPGPVDTPMTAHMEKGGALWTTPERVARDIERAIETRSVLIYTPWFWRYIMLIIRHLPRVIFDKLNI